MKDLTIVALAGLIVLGIYLAGAVGARAQQQAQVPPPAPVSGWVKVQPPDRAMPPTLIITKDVPDGAFLCAEIPGLGAACRPVGEARIWLKQTQKMAK